MFDPACAGGALMDLGVYNVSYIVGLFGEPNQVHYTANVERGIDTSGILTMDYTGFKAVSMAAKDCAAPARCIIQARRATSSRNPPPTAAAASPSTPTRARKSTTT